MPSECIPWRTLARVQLSPSSGLIMTPWPMVPTRIVPFFAMVHLLTSLLPIGCLGSPSRLYAWRSGGAMPRCALRESHAGPGQSAGLARAGRLRNPAPELAGIA